MQNDILAEGDGIANGSSQSRNRNMSPMEKLKVKICLIHILIARIKSNIRKFRHANEQAAELAFSLPIELSNVC